MAKACTWEYSSIKMLADLMQCRIEGLKKLGYTVFCRAYRVILHDAFRFLSVAASDKKISFIACNIFVNYYN
jgi:hypothetical protein